MRQAARQIRSLSLQIMQIADSSDDLDTFVSACSRRIRACLNCDAVGIRILQEDGRIPFVGHEGLDEGFIGRENELRVDSDRCPCISVVRGAVDPGRSFATPGGSFFVNGTSRFLSAIPEHLRGYMRDWCNQAGFETLALIPIRFEDRNLGLIHLADRRTNLEPRQWVVTAEAIAPRLGAAIQNLRSRQAAPPAPPAFRTGQFANDISNLMLAVIGNAELLKDRLGADPDAQKLLSDLMDAAQRAGDLAHRLESCGGAANASPGAANAGQTIHSPAARQQPKAERETDARPVPPQTILLIDDEELVLGVGEAMLNRLGYRVLSARNGQEAVRIARTWPGDIDLAILDKDLSAMDGSEPLVLLRQARGDRMKVIVCGGYASDRQIDSCMQAGVSGFVRKPFRMQELSDAIRAVLPPADPGAGSDEP